MIRRTKAVINYKFSRTKLYYKIKIPQYICNSNLYIDEGISKNICPFCRIWSVRQLENNVMLILKKIWHHTHYLCPLSMHVQDNQHECTNFQKLTWPVLWLFKSSKCPSKIERWLPFSLQVGELDISGSIKVWLGGNSPPIWSNICVLLVFGDNKIQQFPLKDVLSPDKEYESVDVYL